MDSGHLLGFVLSLFWAIKTVQKGSSTAITEQYWMDLSMTSYGRRLELKEG